MEEVFAGVDPGAGAHTVRVVDRGGRVLGRFTAGHDREGLAVLVDRLRRRGAPPAAIERPSGLLVDRLAEAGLTVVPVHPDAPKACRPCNRAVPAKGDPGDACILADVLRTDGHRLRPLATRSDAIRALRALVRGRDDLLPARVALADQLTALLDSFWPSAARVFADIASPVALASLDRHPTPASARRLGPGWMAAFPAQRSYRGRRTPRALLERLRAAPVGHAGEAEGEAKGELVRALARTLAGLVAQLARLTGRVKHAVAALPDGRLAMSFPRAGRLCAAQVLAELGDARGRFRTNDQLAAEAGVAPVTYESGRSRGVRWRWACNKRLRAAPTCFADDSRHGSAWSADVYSRARERGFGHPHAARLLARAWVRVLWRAWTGRQPHMTPADTRPRATAPAPPSRPRVNTGSLTPPPPARQQGSRARAAG